MTVPRNPSMAGGIDHPEIVYEVWACGPPRGGYSGTLPGGFLDHARPWMNGAGIVAFSGPLRIQGAIHVDLNAKVMPDIVGDVADLPRLVSGKVDWVLADPPYGDDYNRALYRDGLQRRIRDGAGRTLKDDRTTYWPHRWLSACARVLRPGGHLIYLDQLVPYGPKNTVCVRRAFVYRGTNLRATCASIFRKTGEPRTLRDFPASMNQEARN